MTDYTTLRAALSFIPVGGHDERFRIAAAIMTECGPEGFELFDLWYRQYSRYNAKESAAVYKSCRSGHYSAGTILGIAKDNGYTPEKPYRPPTQAEREAMEAHRKEADAFQDKLADTARELANKLWAEAAKCERHPYLTKKGIAPHGARITTKNTKVEFERADKSGGRLWARQGSLLLPIRDTDKTLHTLEIISRDGEKTYLPNGRKQGHYFALNGTENGVIGITEGFATGATINEAISWPVAVAFDCSNLFSVALNLRERFPECRITLFADDDWKTDGNPGIAKALAAARAVDGITIPPDFSRFKDSRGEKDSDFNDLARMGGLDEVRRCIKEAI